MLIIHSTDSINYKGIMPANKLKQNNGTKNKAVSYTKQGLSFAGFSVLSIISVIAGKGEHHMISFEETLKKHGLKMENGSAINIATGEKFSGKVKRNISLNNKETTFFEEGQIKEKLYHNALGKELNGEFYKDGELVLSVGKHQGIILKSFPYRKYTNGQISEKGDVFNQNVGSVFGWAREFIK